MKTRLAKMRKRLRASSGEAALPCLYCGVDSGPVLKFFVWMVGAGLLAFAALYLWAWLNGKFSDESVSMRPLEAETEGKDHV
jgi:hypothetical protein